MEDKDIIQLFWDRNEQAIKESSDKYGAYCNTIAYNILKDSSDTEECVNDTWLRAWEREKKYFCPPLLVCFQPA